MVRAYFKLGDNLDVGNKHPISTLAKRPYHYISQRKTAGKMKCKDPVTGEYVDADEYRRREDERNAKTR